MQHVSQAAQARVPELEPETFLKDYAPPSAEDLRWRQQWKDAIAEQARRIVPQWLAGLEAPPEHVTGENLRLDLPPRSACLHDTGAIMEQTAILPAASLLAETISVADTRELVSMAVRWFFGCHHFLPSVVELHPLRYLAVANQVRLPLDEACAAIGCYTIEVCKWEGKGSQVDTVRLRGKRQSWEKEIEDSFYL